MLRLPLAHRHAGLAERPGHQRPVQQVAGTDPQPPLRHDVEGEPGGVLVELADQRVGAGRVEGRPGQFVQRRHDADVRDVGRVRAAEHLREGPDVTGADVGGLAGQRHHERDILGLHPLGEQAHLRVAEQQGRRRPVADDGRGRGHRTRQLRPQPGQAQPDRGPRGGPEQDLLRPQPERPGARARRRGHRDRARPGQPVRRPAERGRQRAAHQDPRSTGRGSRPGAAWPAPPPPPRPARPRPPARRWPSPPCPGAPSAPPRPARRSGRRTDSAVRVLPHTSEPTASRGIAARCPRLGPCGLLRSATGPTWRCGCSRAPRSPTAAITWSSAPRTTRASGGGTSCCSAGWPGPGTGDGWLARFAAEFPRPGMSRWAWTARTEDVPVPPEFPAAGLEAAAPHRAHLRHRPAAAASQRRSRDPAAGVRRRLAAVARSGHPLLR